MGRFQRNSARSVPLARPALDRAAERRKRPRPAAPAAGRPGHAGARARRAAAPRWSRRRGDGRAAPAAAAPRRPATRSALFLGQDEEGTAYVAVVGDPVDEGEPRDVAHPAPGRRVAARRPRRRPVHHRAGPRQLARQAHATAPAAGAPTAAEHGGWVRRCTDDGTEHYPRTDPAVIMSVVDADDRLLLARGPQWGEGRFSVLAGFVEPGESPRGGRGARGPRGGRASRSRTSRYLGDQPWPFPCSLMVGFTATAKDTTFRLDEDEIVEALWVTREELATRGRRTARIGISPRLSIARRLIEHWYGGEIDQRGRVDRPEPADRAEGLTMGDLDAASLALVRQRNVAALATLKRDGRPQLSNVSYTFDARPGPGAGLGDRRPGQGAQPAPGPSGLAASSPAPTAGPTSSWRASDLLRGRGGARTTTRSRSWSRSTGSSPASTTDWDDYRRAMVQDRRLVLRLQVARAYGMPAR